MKFLITVLLMSFLAESSGFSQNEKPAGLSGLEIRWAATTNKMPEVLWTYKVLPENFPDAVVSNLMALGRFTMRDRLNGIPGQRPFRDKSILYFGDKGGSKHLGIFPAFGWIDYQDSTAKAGMGEPIAGVPNEEEAYRLALKYVRLAGIDVSELAVKPDTGAPRVFREAQRKGVLNKSTGQRMTEEVLSRGLMIPRRIDGIDVGGMGLHGGVYLSFGNNAKLSSFQVIWRKLTPYTLHKAVTPVYIEDSIRSGNFKLPPNVGDPSKITSVTLTQLSFVYEGKAKDELQEFVSPFIRLDGVADSESGSLNFQAVYPAIQN